MSPAVQVFAEPALVSRPERAVPRKFNLASCDRAKASGAQNRVGLVRVGARHIFLNIAERIAIGIQRRISCVEGIQAVRALPRVGQGVAVGVVGRRIGNGTGDDCLYKISVIAVPTAEVAGQHEMPAVKTHVPHPGNGVGLPFRGGIVRIPRAVYFVLVGNKGQDA